MRAVIQRVSRAEVRVEGRVVLRDPIVRLVERFVERHAIAKVLHDRGEEETMIISDRLGSRLLFYAEDGARLTFASEAKGVIAGRTKPTKMGGVAH